MLASQFVPPLMDGNASSKLCFSEYDFSTNSKAMQRHATSISATLN